MVPLINYDMNHQRHLNNGEADKNIVIRQPYHYLRYIY